MTMRVSQALPLPRPSTYEQTTERGLELRLARILNERAYWVPAWKQWVYWSDVEERWVRDDPMWIERDGPELLRADFERQLEDLSTVTDSDSRHKAYDEIRSVLQRLEKARPREIVFKAARAHCIGRPDLFDSDAWILGLPGGYVWDLAKGQSRFSDPIDHVSIQTAVFPDEDVSVEWLRFLSAVVPEATERVFLQRSLGAALIGSADMQRIFLWIGSGGNGKTALATVLLKTLGQYAVMSPADILATSRFPDVDDQQKAMARFVGRRLVLLGELSQGAVLNESLVKWITGGEPLVARRLHQDPFEVPNTATFFMLTNHLPRIQSSSDAIWRRLTPLEFRQVFKHNDAFMAGLRADLYLHASALRWLLDGCRDYLDSGLEIPTTVAAFRDDYREQEDHLDAWYEERVLSGPGRRTRTKDVQRDYSAWCQAGAVEPMSYIELGQRLARKGHRANSAKVTGFEKKQRCYAGLALRVESPGNG